jgi:hypothetical protein
MTLRSLFAWFFPAPPEPERARRIHRKFACPLCGRVVAHTAAGKPYRHNCLTPGTVDEATR